jgi:hypothetical protein
MSTQISNVNQTAQHTCQGKCPDTLCWNCRYATGTQMPKTLVLTSKKTGAKRQFQGCPWTTASIAVPGWKAEKTIIKNPEVFGGKQDSYIVYECPHFEPDTRKETTIEEIIEALGLPVRYALSNRLILWDYYDVYKILNTEAKKMYGPKPTSEQILKIKIAAVKAYIEDLEYDLNDKYITQEEFTQKLDLVDTLEKTLRKYHGKQQMASKE